MTAMVANAFLRQAERFYNDAASFREKMAEYNGRKVKLDHPQRGGKRKFFVYTRVDGKVKKVSFGDPGTDIKRDSPGRLKSFRARHGCDDPKVPKPKDGARYWSCKMWQKGKSVSEILKSGV